MRVLGALGFAYFMGVILLGIGWVSNIVQIIHHINDPLTNMMILRWVGIFVAPLGAILGWL